MTEIVAFSSAPVASRVIPPDASVAALPSSSNPLETRSQSALCAVRSGEIANGVAPLLHRLEHLLGAAVEHVRVVHREEERRVPIPAQSRRSDRPARVFIRARMSAICFC